MPEPDERPSVMENVAAYKEELERLVKLLQPLMPALAVTDLQLLHEGLSHLDTVGPILAPSEWMRGGSKNLDDQRALIEAVGPLVSYAQKGFGK